ncbi:DMT family transporter [Schaalia naturae]|uniref:EamA family transporter n=1 Tax=Schaalia naturae TaxID=635203 RepID=UPI00362B424C
MASPSSPGGARAVVNRVPAPFFIVGSGLVQYIGAAVAVWLFTVMEPASVAWWRLAVGAVVLLAWRRPWRDGLTRRDLWASAVFGLALAAMNTAFYEAISRLPLGVAVSLEFLGPVAVAVWRGRGAGPRVAAALALAGVVAIGGLGLDLGAPGVGVGIAWVLGAAAMWAAYIVLGQRIAQERSGITNLALGCTTGSLVLAPLLAPGGAPALHSWQVALAVAAVGVLSTVLPLSLEALALSRLSASTFALLTALLPATSAVIGALMLHQLPGAWELVGLALVSVAVWLASRSGEDAASAGEGG